MAPISEPVPKHVPAWKRIGLKLKYAKEEPENVSGSHTESEANGKKRPKLYDGEFTVDTAAEERPTKKQKKSKSKKEVKDNGDPHSATSYEDKQPSPVAVQTTPSTKRKSVSFAPEAKTEDGEGAKQVYTRWVQEQLAIDPSFDPSSVSPALSSITPPTVRPASPPPDSLTPISTSTAKIKKPKKPKVKQRSSSQPSETSLSSSSAKQPDHPAITYLKTYHTDLPHWKFSKPHQNYLLKHLFSFNHIPSSYDPALLSYLKGLKGASARSRIRTQALTIRDDDEKWLDTDPTDSEKMNQETHAECKARRKRDYNAAVARMKAELRAREDEREEREWELFGGKDEWEHRVAKRRRAEMFFWGVGEEEEIVEEVIALPQSAIYKDYQPPPTIQSKGMGGVETISGTGIAKGSLGKKTVFGDDGATAASAANGRNVLLNGNQKVEAKPGANGVQAKRKRKRKRRTTGVPDDDSSSESSSSSSEDSDMEVKARVNGVTKQQANGKKPGDGDRSSSGSGSGSDSDSDSDSSSGSGGSSSDGSESDSD